MANVFCSTGKGIVTARMRGSGTEPVYIGFGTGSGTSATSDEALFTEVTSQGRVTGTSSQQTTTVTNDTWQVQGTLTAGGTLAITNSACFDNGTTPAQTTLNGTITSGATSLVVASASGFPGSGNYDIQIESEVMTVTAGQGTTTWTVTRGVNGSTAASHTSGVFVTAAKVASGGGNMFVKGDFAVKNLNASDTIQSTITLQFT